MKVKAVLFDMGGTLVKVTQIPETYRRIFEAHGIIHSNEEIASAWEKATNQLDIREMPKLGENFWVRMNALVLEHLGVRENVSSLAEAMDKEWWDYAEISLYPDALAVLHQIRKDGLKMGIITNSLENDIRKVLPKIGLKDFFDVEVGVDTVGKMKPDKEIFLYALQKLGLLPDEVLFIGDSVEIDYKGARNAGLKVLVIDRENEVKEAVEKIQNLEEVLTFVREKYRGES